MDLATANSLAGSITQELGKVLVGQETVLEQAVVALLAGGHALLEGVPGTAKTLLGRALARVTGMSLPADPVHAGPDALGHHRRQRLRPGGQQFDFRPGPVFADIVLADEINRAPAKTQAALLEAMQERQATVDGKAYRLSDVFTVFATQNPVEFEGTYPLPEAQVDRFMLKIVIDYPAGGCRGADPGQGGGGLRRRRSGRLGASQPVLDARTAPGPCAATRTVHVEEMVRRYVTRIIRGHTIAAPDHAGRQPAGRRHADAGRQGARPCWPAGTSSVPTTSRRWLRPCCGIASCCLPEVEVEGLTPDDCLKEILLGAEVPR